MTKFEVVAKVDIPEDAAIWADVAVYFPITHGFIKGEIVQEDNEYILHERNDMKPKDGKRSQYNSGALRSDRAGRGRYDLVSPFGLKRLAIQYEEGGLQKGDRNWEKGFPISRAICSAISHLVDLLAGDRSEDHLAATAWQVFAAMHFEELIKLGRLDPELDDLPSGSGELFGPGVEMQRKVGAWSEEQYKGMTNEAIVIHLRREVEELAENFSPEEAADCFLLLLHLAHKNGFSLTAAAQDKHVVNTRRKWATEPDAEGVFPHLEESE